ncbi:MAG: serine hydrolase [Vicingaceae bacterium]
MKKFKKIGLYIISVLGFVMVLAIITGNAHLFNAVYCTYLQGEKGPTIDDYTKFKNAEINPSNQPFKWALSKNYNKKTDQQLLEKISDLQTVAFLIIKNDSIYFEHYWDQYSDTSFTNSFSMAKTFTALLIGAAIDDGLITSVEDPVGKYLEPFKENKDLKIKHLLNMSSGINFDEDYKSPFGYMAKAYYGGDIKKLTFKYQPETKPGVEWKYLGGNTLLLSFIVEKVTQKPLSKYFEEKIWKKIGAERKALWSLDNNNTEKAYCCFYANARDFAKIGKLFIDFGKFENNQILDSAYVSNMMTPAKHLQYHSKPVDFYGWQTWIADYKNLKVVYARGIQGQYILTIPEKNIIIVRLGKMRSPELINNHPKDIFYYIDFALKITS